MSHPSKINKNYFLFIIIAALILIRYFSSIKFFYTAINFVFVISGIIITLYGLFDIVSRYSEIKKDIKFTQKAKSKLAVFMWIAACFLTIFTTDIFLSQTKPPEIVMGEGIRGTCRTSGAKGFTSMKESTNGNACIYIQKPIELKYRTRIEIDLDELIQPSNIDDKVCLKFMFFKSLLVTSNSYFTMTVRQCTTNELKKT